MGQISVVHEEQLIIYGCISDPQTARGPPGHHASKSIHHVLTDEMRPNEDCLNLRLSETNKTAIVACILFLDEYFFLN